MHLLSSLLLIEDLLCAIHCYKYEEAEIMSVPTEQVELGEDIHVSKSLLQNGLNVIFWGDSKDKGSLNF